MRAHGCATAVLLSAYGWLAYASMDYQQESTINIHDGWATVRGVVQENVQRCQVDGPCYLVLSTERDLVRLYYHYGEYPPCPNERVTTTGLAVEAGDHVLAEGLYSQEKDAHVVNLCCPECHLTVGGRIGG